MSATDELRRMLDERGVKWHDTKIGKGFITVYEHDGITWIVTEHSSGRLSVKGCVKPTQGHYDGMTPEQAIAATLGDGEYERKMNALLCRLTNGKFSKTRAYDLGFMESVVREEFETYAATLGAETCHIKPWKMEQDTGFYDCMECECGYVSDVGDWAKWHFCPNCGKRVVDE